MAEVQDDIIPLIDHSGRLQDKENKRWWQIVSGKYDAHSKKYVERDINAQAEI